MEVEKILDLSITVILIGEYLDIDDPNDVDLKKLYYMSEVTGGELGRISSHFGSRRVAHIRSLTYKKGGYIAGYEMVVLEQLGVKITHV
jgi:hypothetical protein